MMFCDGRCAKLATLTRVHLRRRTVYEPRERAKLHGSPSGRYWNCEPHAILFKDKREGLQIALAAFECTSGSKNVILLPA